MDEKTIIFITFALYLLLMLGIGFYFYKKTQDLSDYVLGGRKLGVWGTAISAQASDMSGWLLLGLPGAAYLTGLSGSVWMALGLAIGTYLNWKIVARRLRVYTEKYNNSLTLSSYLENRFNDKTKVLRIVSAIIILFFFLIYTASGLVSSGKLFQTVFGIPYVAAVLLGLVVVVGYTFLGGFMAVCYTDIIQGLLMFFTILILPVIVVIKCGGLDSISATFNSELLNPINMNMLTGSYSTPIIIAVISIISSVAWGLGYFGQPHILTRFMAIENPDLIKKSRIIAMIWVVLSLAGAALIGLVGSVVLPGLEGSDSELVFIKLVHNYVPVWLAGVLLSAILAAVMSTADSQLLVTASTFSEDIYKSVIKKDATDKQLVRVSRLTVLIVAILAFVIALNPDSSVLQLVSYAWAGFGAAFGPVVLVSLFWDKMSKNGAVAGMIVGGATTVIWNTLGKICTDIWIFKLYEIVPGFLFSLLAIYIFTKIDLKKTAK